MAGRNRTGKQGEALPLGVKVAFLSAPETHQGVDRVEARETRMAWVFLAGDRVLKLKKPVRYPFLDYSTVEKRHRVCADEVRLNRRLAPDVYLGLSRLTVERDGALAIDGDGPVADWLVVMRRLPDALMLDQAIRTGTATPGRLAAVGERLARFYRDLQPVPVAPDTYLSRFTRVLAENRRVFGHSAFNTAGSRGADISRRLQSLLTSEPEIVMDRAAARRIVEGHGDLRPEHVCLSDPPVIIDCLEFSRDLRLLDPFDELGYLTMECAALGAAWVRAALIDPCAELLQDRPTVRLMDFYTAYRATFRARQALAHLLDPHPRTPAKWIPQAVRYLEEAEAAAASLRLPATRRATHPHGGGGSPKRKAAPR